MMSVTENFPVIYLNGPSKMTKRMPPKKNSLVSSISSFQIDQSRQNDTMDYTDSDIDTISAYKSVSVAPMNGTENPSKSAGKEESLMKWLMDQFEQNGLDGNGTAGQQQQHRRLGNRIEEPFSASEVRLAEPFQLKSGGNGEEGREWMKSCPRLNRLRKEDHFYPRLLSSTPAGSRETVNRIKRPTKETMLLIDQVFNELQQKTKGLQNQNVEIREQLLHASAVVNGWSGDVVSKLAELEEMSNGHVMTTNEISAERMTPMIGGKSFSCHPPPTEDRMDLSSGTLPKWMTRKSKTPDTMEYALTSSPFKVSRIPRTRTPPQLCNVEVTHKLAISPGSPNYKSIAHPQTVRRFSSAHPTFSDVDMRSRENSLGPPRMSTPTTPSAMAVATKPSWIDRAVSQVSLNERQTSRLKPYKIGTRPNHNASQTTLNSINPRESTVKGIATYVLRPFQRKASTPGPGSTRNDSPTLSGMAEKNRCMSLMQLNKTGDLTIDRTVRDLRTNRTSPLFSRSRIRSDDDLGPKIEIENVSLPRNKQLFTRKPRLKKEVDTDSGIFSFSAPWRS